LNFTTNYLKRVEFMKELIEEMEHDKKLFGMNMHILHPEDLVNERKNKKFVLFENYLINVKKFLEYHPGGQMAIEDYLYTDVGRYLTGNQAYNKNFKAHAHKYMTLKHAINSMAYAELRDNHQLVQKVLQIETSSRLNKDFFKFSDVDSSYINESNPILLHKTSVAKDTFEYRFSIKKFNFARFLPGIFWIGRHYSVSSLHANKTRYYSISLAMDPKIKEKLIRLMENITRLENRDLIDTICLKDNEMVSDYLPLYIKHYHFKNSLSNHIYNLPVGNQTDLIIRGPIVRHLLNLNFFRDLD
jgi:hypothetical protein